MTRINYKKVPAETQIFKGSRGADYILRNGNKVYVSYEEEQLYPSAKDGWKKPRVTPRHKDSKKRGAYLRFIENQSQVS